MPNQILVVGAVLLDVVGRYSPEHASLRNKAGSARISLGGAAFNVAANLAQKGFNTTLFTCFRRGSNTTQLIRNGLFDSGIDVRHALEVEVSAEPMYVAVFEGKDLLTGVTSSPIDTVDFLQDGALEQAIRECTFIAVDTNLSSNQIQLIVSIAHKHGKPISAGVVSDAKVGRIASIPESEFKKRFEFVCLNSDESNAIGYSISLLLDKSKQKESLPGICAKLNTDTVIVSDEFLGHHVIKRHGQIKHFDAPVIGDANTLGAGDALFSAACASWIKHRDVDSIASSSVINEWIAEVLRTDKANLNSGFANPKARSHKWPNYVFLLVPGALLLLANATFTHGLTPVLFGLSVFFSALLAGAAGALMRRILLDHSRTRGSTDAQLMAAGATAGTVGGLVASLPHLALAKHALSTDIDELRIVPLLAFLVAVAAGIAFEPSLNRIRRSIEQTGE